MADESSWVPRPEGRPIQRKSKPRPGPGGDPSALFQDAPPPPDEERPDWSEEMQRATHNYPRNRVQISRRTREMMAAMSDRSKRRAVRTIFHSLREGLGIESACHIADVTPDWLAAEMSLHEGLRHAVLRERALTERNLVRELRAGGPGMSTAKAALEVLERTFKAWSRKTSVTLAGFLEDALGELKNKLPPDAYDIVVRTLEKHATGTLV